MTRRRKILLSAASVLLLLICGIFGLAARVYADLVPPRYEEMDALPEIGTLSAAQCGACHTAIYEEWRQSGHARAFVDPLYQAEVRDQVAPFVCHRCHAPLVEQRERITVGLLTAWPRLVPLSFANDRFDETLRDEGVTCVACHQVDGALVGPIEESVSPHPTRVGDLRTAKQCAHCHQLGFDFVGHLDRPIIDTFNEWNEYRDAGGDKACPECHMPQVAPRPLVPHAPARVSSDHSLRGPYELEFVKTGAVVYGAELSGSLREGGRAVVDLANETGHRLPSAEPQRSLRLQLLALDANGRELAEATRTFARPVDVVGLREAGPDTTMAPRQRGKFELALPGPLPPSSVELVVRVEFHLWDPEGRVPREAGSDPATLLHNLFERRLPLLSP